MFKRLRQLNISLAAKCQLLFGAAVTLIIAAALWVPWQRMDQLTGQLDVKAAQAVVRTTIGRHVTEARRARSSTGPTTDESRTANVEIEILPSAISIDGEAFLPPHLIPLSAV